MVWGIVAAEERGTPDLYRLIRDQRRTQIAVWFCNAVGTQMVRIKKKLCENIPFSLILTEENTWR